MWQHTGGIFKYIPAWLLSLLPVRYDRYGLAAEGTPVSPWTSKLNGQNDTGAVRWNAEHPSGAHVMESRTLGHVEEGGGSNHNHKHLREPFPEARPDSWPCAHSLQLKPCPGLHLKFALSSCYLSSVAQDPKPMMFWRIQPCKNFELARTVEWSLITNRRRQRRSRLVPT